MILVQNCRMIDPASQTDGLRDILIGEDRITKIAEAGTIDPAQITKEKEDELRILNADGLIAAPGLVDTHVHFRDPGAEYKEDILTGAVSAAAGGVTSVVLMANTNPHVDQEETLSYVLEKGAYAFYIGTSVRNNEKTAYEYLVAEDTVVKQLEAKLTPSGLSKRMLSDGTYEELPQTEGNDPNACAFEKMVPGTDEGILPEVRFREHRLALYVVKKGAKPFIEVAEGKITLDEFISQLSDDDLIELLGGQPNTGVANTFGFGNLPDYGVPNIMTADGPAGLRIAPECGVCTTAWPCATLLAYTWNPNLVEKVGAAGAEEVKENNIAVWLTPAVNIHRNPLCGRNFEYYSEDPLLAGKMAAGMVRGIQSQHIGASVKHFAANNKETNRKHSDSRVSERALREIYLKQFEIIVKESDPWTIMSSYNVINGHRASENKELLEDILRGEWGFQGMVTTDWWTRGEHYKEIKAGNDVKMATGYPERVKKAIELGELTRADLEHCARRVLELILKID